MADDELERIRREYARRAQDPHYSKLYSSGNASARIAASERRRVSTRLLRATGGWHPASLRIIDVGCGGGGEVAWLLEEGAEPRRCVGVDLLPARVSMARSSLPEVRWVVANSERLPVLDGAFDLALCMTVLSSILDARMRTWVVAEIARVLAPGGRLLWYDFRWNPTNPQTEGICGKDVEALLPGWRHVYERVTLAPPISRFVAPRSERLTRTLSHVPFLLSHTIGIGVKPKGPS